MTPAKKHGGSKFYIHVRDFNDVASFKGRRYFLVNDPSTVDAKGVRQPAVIRMAEPNINGLYTIKNVDPEFRRMSAAMDAYVERNPKILLGPFDDPKEAYAAMNEVRPKTPEEIHEATARERDELAAKVEEHESADVAALEARIAELKKAAKGGGKPDPDKDK